MTLDPPSRMTGPRTVHTSLAAGGARRTRRDSRAMAEPGLQRPQAPEASERLAMRRRLPDGRTCEHRLSPAEHRELHLRLLHRHSDGYVELAAGRRWPNGRLQISTRRDPASFLPVGASGRREWLGDLLARADGYAARGLEVFVAPAVRAEPHAAKDAVAHTRALWVDVDGPERLGVLRQFVRERPAHLIVETGGSGGVHAYWLLDRPLPATSVKGETGEVGEPIERAHRRLIHRLGADPACRDRSRVLRLAGTVNHKSGAKARIVWADLSAPGYDPAALVGELPDPPDAPRPTRHTDAHFDDPYRAIAPAEYTRHLTGRSPNRAGFVRCPMPGHRDTHPSCHVGEPGEGWYCFGCGTGGGIYDMASAVLGGPTGPALRGEEFKRARELVVERFGGR
jgi:RepB DNA-primase from phage plasmid